MIKEWWDKQNAIKRVCGLEIIWSPDKGIQTYICSLVLESNAVSVAHQSTHQSLASTLEKLKPIKAPIAVNFSGEGIISRIISINRSGSAVEQAFPGIEKEKFYIQEFAQKDHVIVSLVGRKAVDEVLIQLKDYPIINVSLAGVVPVILRKTDRNTLDFKFGPHLLIFDETEEAVNYMFSNKAQEDQDIRFEGIKVKGTFFNAFVQAFQLFFYPQLLPVGLADWKGYLSVYHRSRKIKLASVILSGITFAVLLINFLLWNGWTEEKKDLESQMIFNRGMVNNRDSLVNKIAFKEQQIRNFGILPLDHQQLFYKIGNAVPAGIKLISININPGIEDKDGYGELVVKGELQSVKAYEQFKGNLLRSKLKIKPKREDFSYNENKKVNLFEIRILLFGGY